MELEENISVLSTIPKSALKKVHHYADLVHSHDIVTQIIEKKDVIDLDLFEGKLYIKIDEDDSICYKFVPSESFNELVKTSIVSKKSELITQASDRLKAVLTKTFKDML